MGSHLGAVQWRVSVGRVVMIISSVVVVAMVATISQCMALDCKLVPTSTTSTTSTTSIKYLNFSLITK